MRCSARAWLAAAAAALALGAAGCHADMCVRQSDCWGGKVCAAEGVCVMPPDAAPGDGGVDALAEDGGVDALAPDATLDAAPDATPDAAPDAAPDATLDAL